jgi:hypothetical protein
MQKKFKSQAQAKGGMPQPADCAVPDSKPLRGVLFTTGGDDCPTQAEKPPNRPATVTNTARVYPRAEPRQGAGTRVLSLSRPRVCLKTRKKKSHTANLVLKKTSGTDNQSP